MPPLLIAIHCSLPLDVTSKEAIMEGKKVIEEKEGLLHILVNKYKTSHISAVR
jgi:hypothetical protein